MDDKELQDQQADVVGGTFIGIMAAIIIIVLLTPILEKVLLCTS